jgi:type II secretory pathway pseudopilin PulG
MNKKGFTLIEILIVIFIIMVIIGVISSNLLGALSKARDTVKKENMRQFVNALRMYYNDYNLFPGTTGGFQGCGASGASVCPAAPCASIEFCAGGTNCTNTIQYMKKFPKEFDPGNINGGEMKYYVGGGGLEFRLFVDLENLADPAITASQTRCPDGGSFASDLYTNSTYVVCEK